MRAFETMVESATPVTPVRDRILGTAHETRDEALVFATSSIVKEITSSHYDGSVVERSVRTERGAYTLQGSRGFEGGHPVVIVFAEPAVSAAAPALPAPELLMARFGLTRKESAVALLLAEDLTNEEVAETLSISPHTARHHTQNVLSKLNLNTRRDVLSRVSRGLS